MLTKEITKISQGRPDVAQGLSAALGVMVNKVAGYDAQIGAFSAQAGTKWNSLLKKYNIAYLLYDKRPSAGHVGRLYEAPDGTGARVDYDAETYTKEDLIPNTILKRPMKGRIIESTLTKSELKALKKNHLIELYPLMKYTVDDINLEIEGYNYVMSQSYRVIDGRNHIDLSIIGEGETRYYYPFNGWKDYLLLDRNCAIFMASPVMKKVYNFNPRQYPYFIPRGIASYIELINEGVKPSDFNSGGV